MESKIDGVWDIGLNKATTKFFPTNTSAAVNYIIANHCTKTGLDKYTHAVDFLVLNMHSCAPNFIADFKNTI